MTRDLLEACAELIGRGAAARFHLGDDGLGAAAEELLQVGDAGVQRLGDVKRAFAERRVDRHHAGSRGDQ